MSAEKLREAANDLCERDPEGLDATFTTAIEALRTLAAQMESAEQGLIAYMRTRRYLANYIVGENMIDYAEPVTNAADAYEAGRTDATRAMQAKLDAANEKVRELEKGKDLQEALYGMRAVRYRIGKVSFQGDENEVKEAMRLCLECTTAERERELLRKEVRRCWEFDDCRQREASKSGHPDRWLQGHIINRSPDVRVLVEDGK